MMARKSDIPFGAQFSPSQVDLPKILQIIVEAAGDRTRITEAIRDTFFVKQADDQRWTLADNCVLALRAYQLLQEDAATPTDVAQQLHTHRDNPAVLYDMFARHILVNLHGATLVETLVAMNTAGDEVTLNTLHQRLEQRGLHMPRGAVHLSSMRLWLSMAGLFDASPATGATLYHVNTARFEQIFGADLDSIDQLTALSHRQRAYLRALVRLAEPGPHAANKVADLATTLYGAQFNHKELPKTVLFPLRDLAYISVMKSTEGRGAKPYEVTATAKFQRELSEPMLTAAAKRAGLVPKDLFSRPLADILDDLTYEDRNVKGRALELLTIYLTRLLDLEFKGWRIRSADTGGAEVDAVVEGARLIFSRWQIQAKNTPVVRIDDIAKEVGLALTFIYANVIMVVTTGEFTRDAYKYANHVMRTSNLNIITLTGADLKLISQNPTSIAELLNRKARHAMQVKERSDDTATK